MEKKFVSDLSKESFSDEEKVKVSTINAKIFDLIKRDYPGITENSCISVTELNDYRVKYISSYLLSETGELSELENTVIASVKNSELLVHSIEENEVKLTAAQKLADTVATFGGSWKFIISFGVFILLWISLNVIWFANAGYDPYPFILLNLILSCIAALQAPIIMMSQNRQEEKDRERAKKDYMINLKSELEIRMLHEKLDHLILHQQQELIEIQKVQIEMMGDIIKKIKSNDK
ncbi:MAG: DUF1003 domain-containing protein [Bacteroidota bacterium]